MVRANVNRILFDGSKVVGVRIRKGAAQHEIRAPVVISDAGEDSLKRRRSVDRKFPSLNGMFIELDKELAR